jgi:hypothetical protein
VFVDLKREYAQSATQNYIFPLFPYEATMVNQYLDALEAKNPQRIEPDRFLLSNDADGTKPLSFRGFTSFVRLLLMHYQFGYAELLGKVDLSQKHGIELLKRTYQQRIEKHADVTPQVDKSEDTFLHTEVYGL